MDIIFNDLIDIISLAEYFLKYDNHWNYFSRFGLFFEYLFMEIDEVIFVHEKMTGIFCLSINCDFPFFSLVNFVEGELERILVAQMMYLLRNLIHRTYCSIVLRKKSFNALLNICYFIE